MMAIPTIERLNEVFDLDPSNGALLWRARLRHEFKSLRACQSWNGRYAGKIAGTIHDGYIVVSIDDVDYRAHRVAWAIRNGKWPGGDIDHQNHDRADNSDVNLRDVTRGMNTRNASRRSDNKSGVTGVHFYQRLNKWRVSVGAGKDRHVGYFDKFDDAVSARQITAAARGYHCNHGN